LPPFGESSHFDRFFAAAGVIDAIFFLRNSVPGFAFESDFVEGFRFFLNSCSSPSCKCRFFPPSPSPSKPAHSTFSPLGAGRCLQVYLTYILPLDMRTSYTPSRIGRLLDLACPLLTCVSFALSSFLRPVIGASWVQLEFSPCLPLSFCVRECLWGQTYAPSLTPPPPPLMPSPKPPFF